MSKQPTAYNEIMAERARIYQDALKKCRDLSAQAEAAKADSTQLHRLQRRNNEIRTILMAYLLGTGMTKKSELKEALQISDYQYNALFRMVSMQVRKFKLEGPPKTPSCPWHKEKPTPESPASSPLAPPSAHSE